MQPIYNAVTVKWTIRKFFCFFAVLFYYIGKRFSCWQTWFTYKCERDGTREYIKYINHLPMDFKLCWSQQWSVKMGHVLSMFICIFKEKKHPNNLPVVKIVTTSICRHVSDCANRFFSVLDNDTRNKTTTKKTNRKSWISLKPLLSHCIIIKQGR